jgi:hypothetical protein
MGFTVNHSDGMVKDSEFQAYARLLRQSGVDLGKVPRVRENETPNRWLYVWKTEEEARAFAKELKKRTGQPWVVHPVNAPASEGPLGPLMVQLVRQGNGLVIALHTLSRALIRSAFPDARSPVCTVFIGTETWSDFRREKGGLSELVREILPNLTGLTAEQIEAIGYSVTDTITDQTVLSVPPREVVRG